MREQQPPTVILAGNPGEVRFKLQVARAVTGEVEEYDMVGQVSSVETGEEPKQEQSNG